jgi:FkbM family methyltransferase
MLLDLKQLKNKYNMNINGVIHIGAHYGQEYLLYKELGIINLIFFEPLKSNYEVLISNVPQNLCKNVALGSSENELEMYVEEENQGGSSSLLEPVLHSVQYPHIVFNKKEKVKVKTLDSFNLNNQFNMINIDVQGYELEVLKGSLETLKNIDYVIAEVNRAEVYKNCCKVNELDDFLSNYGLRRVETTWDGITWGDAFYAKKFSV